MKKKLLTLAMAATMAVSTVISAFAAETLTGTAWWTGSQVGKDYAVPENGSTTLVVESEAGTGGEAFSVEVYKPGTGNNDGYFFTTGSDGNAWLAEALANNGTVSCPFADNNGADPLKFISGHTYEVTVTRNANNLEVVYFDATDSKEMYKMTAECTVDLPAELNVHVMAQVGSYTVDVKAEEEDTTEEKTTEKKADDKEDNKADSNKTTEAKEDADDEGINPMVIVVVIVVAVVVVAGIVVATKKKN